MNLQTPVHIPAPGSPLHHHHRYLFVGSCFADHIGAKFAVNKFPSLVNPYGVLYNPLSVLYCLQDGLAKNNPKLFFVEQNELWHSFRHHGKFSQASKEELEHAITETCLHLQEWMKQVDVLFITWGTAWVYRYKENGQVVSNCHKIPAREFDRFRLSVDEIVTEYSRFFSALQETFPETSIVLTVSPVRHLKDTAHGNQLSKSVLLLAAEELTQQFPQVSYFPSYEIVLDELRDYRFYESDMVHPNALAVDYIWEKLVNAWMEKDTTELMKQVQKLVSAAQHRPYNVETDSHQKFVKRTLEQIKQLGQTWPQLNFENEITQLTAQLR